MVVNLRAGDLFHRYRVESKFCYGLALWSV